MLVSLIPTMYKDPVAMRLLLEAMRKQTYTNFEVIVAEDDNSQEIKDVIAEFTDIKVKHVFHPDNGRMKTVAQNKAICKAEGEYIVLIDGDCIPYTTFIEYHVMMAKKGVAMSGRRANLNAVTSAKLRDGTLQSDDLEKAYWFYYLKNMFSSEEDHVEQGISLNPEGLLYKLFLKNRVRNTQLLGSHIACFKEDMQNINGFNEDYHGYMGEDTDLNWRFKASGMEVKSCKNTALLFHLYHKRVEVTVSMEDGDEMVIMKKEQEMNRWRCVQGLDQHC